jgi:hypothetical protein
MSSVPSASERTSLTLFSREFSSASFTSSEDLLAAWACSSGPAAKVCKASMEANNMCLVI